MVIYLKIKNYYLFPEFSPSNSIFYPIFTINLLLAFVTLFIVMIEATITGAPKSINKAPSLDLVVLIAFVTQKS